jgi:hypothetical protein
VNVLAIQTETLLNCINDYGNCKKAEGIAQGSLEESELRGDDQDKVREHKLDVSQAREKSLLAYKSVMKVLLDL